MRGINKVTLLGHVGQDPEVRYTPAGTAVANFSVATSEKYKDKDGNQQEKTEWHRLVAWDKLAEIVEKYVTKGSLLYVEGQLQTRQYEDKEGVTKYTTEIRVKELQLLGGGNSNEVNDNEPQESKPARAGGKASATNRARPRPPIEPEGNDDLPF